jgi:polyisoprenoid-binding protein YceI
MKNTFLYGCLAAIGLLVAFKNPAAKRKIMADKSLSTITYAAVHPLHKWEGVSREVNSAMMYNDETKLPENLAVSVKVASFDSQNNNRDSHAVEVLEGIKFPNVTFVSSDIKAGDNGSLVAKGNLTFHGVTKPVTLQATRKEEGGKMTLNGEFLVSMSTYNIERPSLMGLKTEDQMTLKFNVVFPVN